jgi:protein-serine/threonine kinase
MLTGLPPFYSKDTNRMYEMILNKELDYPEYLNPQIVNLVSSLI